LELANTTTFAKDRPMPMMIRSYAHLAIVSAALATCTDTDKSAKSLTKEGADSLGSALAHIVDTSGTFKKMAHRYASDGFKLVASPIATP
jgi:hypothetical protein